MDDLLYPDNPKRQEKVVELHQELIDSIELNFDAVNTLIEVLNTHWPHKLSPIKMKKEGIIQENCDVFLTVMKSIQDVLQDVDKRLSSELEPECYKKLLDLEETDTMKMKILHDKVIAKKGLAGDGAWPLFGKLIYSKVAKNSLSEIVASVGKVSTSVIGSAVASAVGVLAFELIFGAIMGAMKKKKLEEAIQELQPLVDEFKPASKKYYETIIEVKVMFEMLENI